MRSKAEVDNMDWDLRHRLHCTGFARDDIFV
jgi:hypothetical protein